MEGLSGKASTSALRASVSAAAKELGISSGG